MTWPREVDHIDIVILDEPVQVDIDEAQAGRCAPVSEQAGLDMFGAQWFSQQRVILEVDLADGQVIGGVPVFVHQIEACLIDIWHGMLLSVN